jgi:hypothetical protein
VQYYTAKANPKRNNCTGSCSTYSKYYTERARPKPVPWLHLPWELGAPRGVCKGPCRPYPYRDDNPNPFGRPRQPFIGPVRPRQPAFEPRGKTFPDPAQPRKRCHPITILTNGCTLQALGAGTSGVCAGAMAGLFYAVGINVCVQQDRRGVFVTTTPVGLDTTFGFGAGVGIDGTVSNARGKDSLDGPSDGGASGRGAYGAGASWGEGEPGETVVQVNGGLGAGVGGMYGQSQTYVSDYLFMWCGWWICHGSP